MSQRMPKFFISLMQKTMKFESLQKYLHYRSRQRGLIILIFWTACNNSESLRYEERNPTHDRAKNAKKILKFYWSWLMISTSRDVSIIWKEGGTQNGESCGCALPNHRSLLNLSLVTLKKENSKKFRCDTAFVQFARNTKLSCHENANLTHQYAGIDDLLKYRQRTSMNKKISKWQP